MKFSILFLSLILFLFADHLFGQGKLNTKAILGKWKIDVMRDKSGNAFDIATTSEENPEIYTYLAFNQNRTATLFYGNLKWKGKWNIQHYNLVIHVENKPVISYNIISLKNNKLILGYNLKLEKNQEEIIKLYYKRT